MSRRIEEVEAADRVKRALEDGVDVFAISMFTAAEMLAEKLGCSSSSCLRAMADLADKGWSPVTDAVAKRGPR